MPCTHPLSAACPAETQSAAPTCVCVLRQAHTWHRCPTELHAQPLAVRAPVGSPGHLWLSWAPTCECLQSCLGELTCKHRGVCVHVCVLCARVCAHTQVPGTGMHTHVCTAHGASLGVRVGGQHTCGLACAVPRHHQMVPCLRGTFRGHKPAPCTGTWGWFMRGHRPLCQAEPASTARGE